MIHRRNLELSAWALYDWASSGYAAIIQTFVFAPYFIQHIATDKTLGSTQWGFTIAFAGFIVSIGGPIFGAIADQSGRRKNWIATFTLLCVVSTALLWFVQPTHSYLTLSLVLLALGTIGSEFAFIFYNAMLPDLAEPNTIGRWSGWGWSVGYAGGLMSLLVAYYFFINPVTSWISVDQTTLIHVRATFPFTALWYLLFSLPFFFMISEIKPSKIPLRKAVYDGLVQLKTTFLNVHRYTNIIWFLVARMFFINGLTTLFAFAGVFAASIFDMSASKMIIFGIALHVTSGLGAALFGWVDDWIGSKRLIIISLTGLIIPTSVILLVKQEFLFWILSLIFGIFVGPVQAASRSMMVRLIPQGLQNEMFGFFAFSGKATAFSGPLLVALLTYHFDSLRVGMSVIIVLFLIGGLIMTRVKE